MWNDCLNRGANATFPEKKQSQAGSQLSVDKMSYLVFVHRPRNCVGLGQLFPGAAYNRRIRIITSKAGMRDWSQNPIWTNHRSPLLRGTPERLFEPSGNTPDFAGGFYQETLQIQLPQRRDRQKSPAQSMHGGFPVWAVPEEACHSASCTSRQHDGARVPLKALGLTDM
jgi:hypothetical protein